MRAWAIKRKQHTFMGITASEFRRALTGEDEPIVLQHGTVGSEFDGKLETALQNGVVFRTPEGTEVFYCKNVFGELPEYGKFVEDMNSLGATQIMPQ